MFPQARTRGGPASRLWALPLTFLLCLLLAPHPARSAVDPCQSEVHSLCYNPLLVVPDATGDPLGDIGLLIVVRDEFGIPIPGIPASAFDIQAADGGQSFLRGYTHSLGSGSTDGEGRILLTGVFSGGGSIIAGELLVTVDEGGGPVALDCNPLPVVDFRSPDLDGDLTVGLYDAIYFSGCMLPNYCAEADFDVDGVVGLSDLVIMQKYVQLGMKSAHAGTISSREKPALLVDGVGGLFNGCLQRDFDEDGTATTLLDSLIVYPGSPFNLSIVATGFNALAGVTFDLTLPPGVMLYPGACFNAEPPFLLAPGQSVPCGGTSVPTISLTIGAADCIRDGPVFVCHLQFASTVVQKLFVQDFVLSGTMSDCAQHPHETVACIGSPTPCEVSTLEIGSPLFLTCPAGDLAVTDTVTVTLKDAGQNPVPGIAASEIELRVFDEVSGADEGRFRLTPLAGVTDANGELPYRFEPKEGCRWDGCFDLLITATIESCQLSASKHVRTVNVVRWEDDPLMPPDDVINDSDMQAVSDAMFTANSCLDLTAQYRCPVVTQASLDMVNTHYGHSCSITASPQLIPAPRMLLGQNVPNPFNPSTVLTVTLTREASNARLEVYTLDGRHVRTLWSGPLHAGDTQFTWDGTDAQARPVASGIYLAQFSSGADHASVRMVLLR